MARYRRRSSRSLLSWLLFLPLMDWAFRIMMKTALVWPYTLSWKALKYLARRIRPAH